MQKISLNKEYMSINNQSINNQSCTDSVQDVQITPRFKILSDVIAGAMESIREKMESVIREFQDLGDSLIHEQKAKPRPRYIQK